MHELGLTQSILDIALDHASKSHARRILKVRVVAGDLAGVIEESLELYFDYLSRSTIAEGADLVIEHVPAVIACGSCGERSEVGNDQVFTCPHCGALAVELLSGREFYVDSIEVE